MDVYSVGERSAGGWFQALSSPPRRKQISITSLTRQVSMMYRTIGENKDKLARLCAVHGVRSLSLFGSATTDRFDPEQSDLDFLVEFKPMSPEERADHYFGLMEDLQALFGITVDLVEAAPIRNPLFRAAVEESRISPYDAA